MKFKLIRRRRNFFCYEFEGKTVIRCYKPETVYECEECLEMIKFVAICCKPALLFCEVIREYEIDNQKYFINVRIGDL